MSEDIFRTALAQSSYATLLTDREGIITFASDRVEATFGIPAGELAGRRLDVLLPEHLRALYHERWRQYRAPRELGATERVEGLHADGHTFPLDVAIMPLGERVMYTLRDASRRREREQSERREAALLAQRTVETEAMFRLFVEHAPAAVAMFDRAMRYLVVSNRWIEDYRLQGQAIIGRSHYEIFPDLPPHWKALHRRGLAGEVLHAEEESFVTPDGKQEWLRWDIVPWRTAEGEVGGIMLMTELVTQRRLAEIALARSRDELEDRVVERTYALEAATEEALLANARKSRFLAAASHDLRQPLQASSAYLAALARKLDDEDLRTLCNKARQPLQAMGDILDVLLDIAQLETGAIAPAPRDFGVAELFARVAAGNQPQADAKGLSLVVADTGAIAHSDPALLERVIDNFVSNAIRYTAQGAVTITCAGVAEGLRLSVSDTGMGIPEDAIEAIFEDYVQLANPARDRRQGLGLGLSIVRHLAGVLGARLDVKSIPGRGSTFSIIVPEGARAHAAHTAVATDAPAAAATPATIVLIVDDDPGVADSLATVLSLDGFDPHCARSGEDALALVRAGLRPALLVSDFRLPGLNGMEVIRRVRETMNASIPAVLMTGDTAIRQMAADLAARCTVVHKPVDSERLSALLHDLAA